MTSTNAFGRRVFLWAGLYGIAVLLPQYPMENRLAQDFSPLTHPVYFYGFIGVALAWQFAFIVISRDVVRFRPLMLPAAAEKFLFVVPAVVLYLGGRADTFIVGGAAVDLLLGVLFIISYIRVSHSPAPVRA